jgi:hypothetical protein
VSIRLEAKRDGEPALSAALFLTSIEGMYLLKAIGCGAIADSAMTELAACLQRRR